MPGGGRSDMVKVFERSNPGCGRERQGVPGNLEVGIYGDADFAPFEDVHSRGGR
jgi:hypothetical protein